jgi:MFS family permease
MNSQNTPVHIRLWHRDFWLMAIANLLLTAAVYILVPTLPQWLVQTQGLSMLETGVAMAAFGVGLFVFGAFVSFLVQHYRRNVVCIWSVLAMGALSGLLYYIETQRCEFVEFWLVVLQRFLPTGIEVGTFLLHQLARRVALRP